MAAEIVALEGVWGDAFAALAEQRPVDRAQVDDPAELPHALDGARAVIVRNRTPVTAGLLDACPALEVVARAGVGLDNIDVGAADARGVVVAAALGINATSVAEHTLGLALALARDTVVLDRETRAGGWDRRAGRELAGGTWGLLGAGATGQACARLARGLGMDVLAHDPPLAAARPEIAALGIRFAALDEVVGVADVVSCHLPATADTRAMIDARLLARFKPGALFINVGRGELVDEDALADAVASGVLGGAALDVRASEPPTPGRLETLDRVLLTPHVAGITAQSQARIATALAAAIGDALSGRPAAIAVGAIDVPRRGAGA